MSVFAAVGFKIAAMFFFALMDAFGRWAGQTVPVGEVVFFRSAFGIVPLLIFYAWRGQLWTALRTGRPAGHAVRGLFGVGGMFTNFASLARLPIADVMAIYFFSPLITVALAATVLREKVGVYRWSAVVIGLIGVMLTLAPHLSIGHAGAISAAAALGGIFAVLCAAFDAGAAIQVRRLTASESTVSIVLYFSIICMVAGLCTLPFGWIWPSREEFIVLSLIGLLGGISHIFLTESFRYAQASLLAPLDYVAILWSIAFGWLMFGEIPGPLVLMGAAIVVAAGLFVIWRERQLRLRRREQPA